MKVAKGVSPERLGHILDLVNRVHLILAILAATLVVTSLVTRGPREYLYAGLLGLVLFVGLHAYTRSIKRTFITPPDEQ